MEKLLSYRDILVDKAAAVNSNMWILDKFNSKKRMG